MKYLSPTIPLETLYYFYMNFPQKTHLNQDLESWIEFYQPKGIVYKCRNLSPNLWIHLKNEFVDSCKAMKKKKNLLVGGSYVWILLKPQVLLYVNAPNLGSPLSPKCPRLLLSFLEFSLNWTKCQHFDKLYQFVLNWNRTNSN